MRPYVVHRIKDVGLFFKDQLFGVIIHKHILQRHISGYITHSHVKYFNKFTDLN